MARKEKKLDKLDDTIDAITVAMRKSTKKTVKQMANIVKKEAEKNSSKEDVHTPTWLRQHGHPYKERNIHSTPIVHKQPDPKRGRYANIHIRDNIQIFKGDRKDELDVGVDEEKVPYIDYVINGSPKLIARDFLAYSLLKARKKLRKKVVKNFKKTLRSKRLLKDAGSLKKK